MIKDISIIVRPEEDKNNSVIQTKIFEELKKSHTSFTKDEVTFERLKKSIDARHGQVKFNLRYRVYIGEKAPDLNKKFEPCWKNVKEANAKNVIIVGSGPAGLFGAFELLERGIRPIIIERGCDTEKRRLDINSIQKDGSINEDSNYCFGEGGAGTFSDGKIYSRSNKRGNIDKVLQIFVYFGASDKILTDAHPHIGTDRLPKIIEAMRNKIVELGGEFRMNTKCTGFITEGQSVKGVHCEDTISKDKLDLLGDAVLLATGHSSSEIYELISKISPVALQAKTFAVGVRVEHPRELIDAIQYHGQNIAGTLPTAEYRLTTQVDGRGVYSFCMCPGGYIVPSSTEKEAIVVNGMSTSLRNSKWSNSAIVVETRPEDIPEEFVEQAKQNNCGALAGLYFRTWLEKETYKQGKNNLAPAQRLTDFIEEKESSDLPETSYLPGVVSSNLSVWLPTQISFRLREAFLAYNKNMKGFVCKDAILVASETRTSTPVRITRDEDSYECKGLSNLYPAGEGSGYAGGITSSALDGQNACIAIAKKLS